MLAKPPKSWLAVLASGKEEVLIMLVKGAGVDRDGEIGRGLLCVRDRVRTVGPVSPFGSLGSSS
jgi:hypothetical protein